MRFRPRLLLASAGVALLVTGAVMQAFLGVEERPENNFITMQFYVDRRGIALMLLGAFIIALGIWK